MIYRKHGSVARWENGTLIRVTESGLAVEDGDFFECRPSAPPVKCGVGSDPIPHLTLRAREALRGIPFERLIITHGIAEHECGGRAWREETERIHASLIHGKLRALIDQAGFDTALIEQTAHALRRADPRERELRHLRIEPNVTAALLPHLPGRTPPNVRLLQTAGGVDGYGRAIVEAPAIASGEWPNAYRPSYRVRPIRMPLNLRLECADTSVPAGGPRAVALLEPVAGLTIRVLVIDGDEVYPAAVTVDRIRSVSDERVWYPYGGGSFGAAMML